MQNSRNSATVCSSTWLSLASIKTKTSSSAASLSPNVLQYSPDFNLMIQMPSPAEPRFCFTTRGWKATVYKPGDKDFPYTEIQEEEEEEAL